MYVYVQGRKRRGVDSSAADPAMFDESSRRASPASLERPPRMSRMQIESVEYHASVVAYTRVG